MATRPDELFALGRLIRDQITGQDRVDRQRQQELDQLQIEAQENALKEAKARQKREEIQQRLEAAEINRTGAIQAANAMEGRPGPSLMQFVGAARKAPLQGVDTGVELNLPTPDVELPHRPVTIPGVSVPEAGVNVPSFQVRPRTQTDVLRQQAAAQDIENSLTLPPIPGITDSPAVVDKRLIPFLSTVFTQNQITGRQEDTQEFERRQGNREARRERQQAATERGFESSESEKERKARLEQERMRQSGATARTKIAAASRRASPSSSDSGERDLIVNLPGGESAVSENVNLQAGNQRRLTADLARQYLNMANGDAEAARRLAREDGWVLE